MPRLLDFHIVFFHQDNIYIAVLVHSEVRSRLLRKARIDRVVLVSETVCQMEEFDI